MGTEISLDIAGVTLDWSKNSIGTDHGALFQCIDRKRVHSDQINYEYFKENNEDLETIEMAFARPLKDILPRLELLGFTRKRARLEYHRLIEEFMNGEENETLQPNDIMSFEEFCSFIAEHPILTLDHVYDSQSTDKQNMGRFFNHSAIQRIPRSYYNNSIVYSERSCFIELIAILHPYSVLRVLGENAENRDAEVVWQYGPLVESGWANEAEFIPCARRSQTFLIATEGTSDVHILNHAISILRPEIKDFFRFIDVKDRHPFPGAGSLVNFAEGLAKIDVQNQIIFLFDNDAEGYDACCRIKKLLLPPNMRTIMLPEIEQFRAFRARGPEGIVNADINRRAAAIECYLDLNYAGVLSPLVIWTNYKKDLDIYQGALENKEIHVKAFLKQTTQSIATNSYDISKINIVLDALIAECCSIAESTHLID